MNKIEQENAIIEGRLPGQMRLGQVARQRAGALSQE
jgi:hypothetical protein